VRRAVAFVVQDDVRPDIWSAELELLVRIGHRFGRVDLRRRMRAYVHGLLGPVGRKNSWQLAEHAGHHTTAGLQHLLSRACWDPDEVRDDLQEYVAEKLGDPAGVLIIDDTGFIKKGTDSAGCSGSTPAPRAASRTARSACSPPMPPPGAARWWTGSCNAFATKGDLAKAVIMRALASPLPIAWVTADSAYGQEWRLRRMLEEADVSYVLAVPKSQHVHAIGRIDFAMTQAPEDAWERHSCGAGEKGPRVYDWAAARLPAIDDFDGDAPTPTTGGCWPAAAWPARTRSPTTSPMHQSAPPSPNWY